MIISPVRNCCACYSYSITSSARPSSVSGTVEAERLGGLEIDDQLDFGGLLHRQVGRLLALEDAAGVDADHAIQVCNAGSVAHQAAGRDELAIRGNRRHRVAGCQCGELLRFCQRRMCQR